MAYFIFLQKQLISDSKKNPTLVNKSGKIAMKKNITIKSNINKTVKIQYLG